eukprot:767835-Hanusia_phi.AAC.7
MAAEATEGEGMQERRARMMIMKIRKTVMISRRVKRAVYLDVISAISKVDVLTGSGWEYRSCLRPRANMELFSVLCLSVGSCAGKQGHGCCCPRSICASCVVHRSHQIMANKIVHDEQQLARDLKQQQQLLRAGLKTSKLSHSESIRYPDGCTCACPSSGCDEEKGQGPVCTCPTDAKMPSLPDAVSGHLRYTHS